MMRFLKLLTSALGVLGFASALLYIWLVYMAFQPTNEWAADFLVGPSDREFRYTFLIVFLPYIFLVAHLYLRTQLGGWMVNRQAPWEALNYCLPKLKRGLMRSKTEALHHRLAAGRAYVALMKYPEALKVLTEVEIPKKGALRVALLRWSSEAALRLNAREQLDRLDREELRGGAKKELGALWACRAESALLKHDRDAYLHAAEQSGWYDRAGSRLAFSAAMAELEWELSSNAQELGQRLQSSSSRLNHEVPGRSQELAHLLEGLSIDPEFALLPPDQRSLQRASAEEE